MGSQARARHGNGRLDSGHWIAAAAAVPVIQRLASMTRHVELRCTTRAASVARPKRVATHHMVETNGGPAPGSDHCGLASSALLLRVSKLGPRCVLRPAAMATANTAHGHMPWPLAVRASRGTTSRPTAGVRAASAPRAWTGRPPPPPRHAVAAKAGTAEVRPSSSPDAVTYAASISTDVPLYEPPGVSFDEYLQDRARVFRAMFPDESRSQRISDGEWRIQILPLQFLLLTVRPVVVMQLRHRGGGGGLDLRITEWELQGLDSGYAPASFDLGVRGSLYADRSHGGRRTGRMKGYLEIAITCVLPPALRLVSETVLRGVAESVLSRLAEKMKRDVDVGLVADFQRFRREKAAASGAIAPEVDATTADRDAT